MTAATKHRPKVESQILQTLSGELKPSEITHLPVVVDGLPKPFTLSWSHYIFLLGVKNDDERSFYNRLLRCYVLIDLKLGRLTHQDLGQMQMYVNHYDRHVKLKEEGSTIGVILCKQKNKALVEITLPERSNIHAREYQLYLPSKRELQKKLLEWVDASETSVR